MKTLNLNTLETAQHAIEKDGVTHAVRAITARIASIMQAAQQATGLERMALLYDAAAALVPSMARTEIDDLTMRQVLGIIQLATEQVDAVEAAATDPNGRSSAPVVAGAEPVAASPTAT